MSDREEMIQRIAQLEEQNASYKRALEEIGYQSEGYSTSYLQTRAQIAVEMN